MSETHALRLVLDRFSVHDGVLELLKNAAMNSIALQNATSGGFINAMAKANLNRDLSRVQTYKVFNCAPR